MNAFRRAGLCLTVFLTGAAVMVIELLGTRLIAPFYGTSLYFWSSLIAVTLIAFATGYFAGGRWADRTQRVGLSVIIALAAILILLIPLTTRPVLMATDPLGLRAGAFFSALTLLFPSLTLLGMAGPFAIKLTTSRPEGVGNCAGAVYAVSTLGSVVGALVLDFYLFPLLGSREILLGLGIVLLLLALSLSVYEQKYLRLTTAVLSYILPAIAATGLLLSIAGARQPIDLNYPAFGAEQHTWLAQRLFPVDESRGTLLIPTTSTRWNAGKPIRPNNTSAFLSTGSAPIYWGAEHSKELI